MRNTFILSNIAIILFFILTSGCSKNSSDPASTSGSTNGSTITADVGTCTGNGDGNNALPSVSGINVLSISINNLSLCSYNQPCTSVTICNPGTSTCQTVSNILVDTGSYGLRVFSSALSGLSLTQVTAGAGGLAAECMTFGSANTWGPVKTADVVLGGEAAVTMPIQVIDSSFGTVPSACQTPFAPLDTPANAGFNGILGVGLGQYDCGNYCVTTSNNGVYYSCTSSAQGSTCTNSILIKASQVINPVFAQATDNNGVIFQLPTISSAGVTSANGNLILGIGTKSNNAVSGSPQVFKTDGNGNFTTVFASQTMTGSFIDSGSNGLFFPQVTQTNTCSSTSSFYCPSSYLCLSGVMKSATTSTQATISFGVANLNSVSSGMTALNDMTGLSSDANSFDWGLPFFYGRTVYTQISAKTSTLGTGPLWAF